MARTFKSLFVELVSFLTLFALVGTMTSNFWERYLIQSELSNMKSSLHILKETINHIGAAYDTLHYELKGLADMKEIKSTKSIPKELKDSSFSKHRDSDIFNTFSTMIEHQIMKIKAKSVGNTAPEGHNKSIGIDISKGNDKSTGNTELKGQHKSTGSAEIKGQHKSIGDDPLRVHDKNIGFSESKEINFHSRPQQENKSDLTNVTTITRNPLQSTGVNIPELTNKPTHNCQNINHNTKKIQRCCRDYDCCEYNHKY